MAVKTVVVDRGVEAYPKTQIFQKQMVKRVIQGGDWILIFVVHTPVITIGRSGSDSDVLVSNSELKKKGIEKIESERGGKVTYHGPGQIVVYPIFNIKDFSKDVHLFLRSLENTIIELLTDFGLDAHPGDNTGVFVGDKKIASIGIALRRWVSYHGISLNVKKDPNINLISPCGINPGDMISLEELGIKVKMSKVKEKLKQAFKNVYGLLYS